jgi:hypothetical protein
VIVTLRARHRRAHPDGHRCVDAIHDGDIAELLVVRAALANALLVRSGGLLFELVPVVALLLVLLGLLVLVLVVLVAVAVLVVVVALAVLVLVVAVRGRAIGVGRSSRGASSAR